MRLQIRIFVSLKLISVYIGSFVYMCLVQGRSKTSQYSNHKSLLISIVAGLTGLLTPFGFLLTTRASLVSQIPYAYNYYNN